MAEKCESCYQKSGLICIVYLILVISHFTGFNPNFLLLFTKRSGIAATGGSQSVLFNSLLIVITCHHIKHGEFYKQIKMD